MTMTHFPRRIYHWDEFQSALRDILDHLPDLRTASRAGRINQAFAEKIMLAVTRVNGCRYCAYGHSRAALAAGVSASELQQIMAGELGNFPEQEAIALTFAQHYAETGCQPDPSAWQRLVDYYGSQAARDMLAYLRMITFGNLYGNTFDGFLSRLAGRPAEGSSFFSELGVLVGVIVIVPVKMFTRYLKHFIDRGNRSGKKRNLVEE